MNNGKQNLQSFTYIKNIDKSMHRSLGPDMLELLWRVKKVIRIRFDNKLALVGFLHKILVTLSLRKPDGIFFGLEVEMRSLHAIGRRLPSHQWVLPSVTLLQDIPVHTPVVGVPGSRLRGRFCRAVYSESPGLVLYAAFGCAASIALPNGTTL